MTFSCVPSEVIFSENSIHVWLRKGEVDTPSCHAFPCFGTKSAAIPHSATMVMMEKEVSKPYSPRMKPVLNIYKAWKRNTI